LTNETDNELFARLAEEETEFRDQLLLALKDADGDLGTLLHRGFEGAFHFSYARGKPLLLDWLSRLSGPAARLKALETIVHYREEEEECFNATDLAIHTVTLQVVNTIIGLCGGPEKSLKGRIDELSPL
jgi:hypothetical protein